MSSSLPLPPGSSGLPVIGETFGFLNDPDFSTKRHKQFGNVFRTNLFGRSTIVLSGVDAVRFVLLNENQYFVISWPPSVKTLLGSASVPVQQGSLHQQRRKLLVQAFQPRALASYIPTMTSITQNYLDRWAQKETIRWYPELRNYTLDIACQLIVGISSGSQTRFGELFEIWVKGLFSVPLKLPGTKFSQALTSRQLLLDEIERVVKARQSQENIESDSLSLLLNAKDEEENRLSIDELKDQVLTLLFAGHETLTSAIASFCLLMAQHPAILERLRAEQSQFKNSDLLTLEDLKQMEFLDQVLKEVLRVVSPVGGGFREVIQECEFDGYKIPKGSQVLYEIGQTHQDSTLYPNPKQFDPERFNPEQKLEPFSHVPFGGGIRECLGKEFARLEMRIFAALLIRNYEWELLPGQNLDLQMIPTPQPKDGLQVKFRRKAS
ncbi:cytochrome P450 [Leptolyngbya boryana CZ1]|uniref:Cytochrome P450 n=1 Tax=Leptolyngbya boryana CZ1 TaxID=3060204 RepID=A0AA96WYR6_LEPBY|nr:cytochrome P450 [Leptolyngbya boryana]WNZ46594.1 cytochrome P450 [Leptolyngbya boryana CZ1]